MSFQSNCNQKLLKDTIDKRFRICDTVVYNIFGLNMDEYVQKRYEIMFELE